MSSLVSIRDIREARDFVYRAAVPTPLLPLKGPGRPGILLKCENLQRTGAFKIRGASNRIFRLPRSCRGVTASSSGNHAQAVALAARMRGIAAVVVMLDQSLPHKVEATRRYGAEVILGGRTSVAIRERAEREAAERGYVYIPPFSDPLIIAGQGTAGLEIARDCPDARSVVVPVGGGGLLSGIAVAVKRSLPRAKVFGVEPESIPKMARALEAGRVVALEESGTVADGLKPVCVSELTLEHAREYVDGMAQVSDAEILEAARRLLLEEKLVVEPSGAAAVAAVRSGRLRLPRGPAVCVLSGGNADMAMILNPAPGA